MGLHMSNRPRILHWAPWSKSLDLSEPYGPHLKHGDNDVPHPPGLTKPDIWHTVGAPDMRAPLLPQPLPWAAIPVSRATGQN